MPTNTYGRESTHRQDYYLRGNYINLNNMTQCIGKVRIMDLVHSNAETENVLNSSLLLRSDDPCDLAGHSNFTRARPE